MKSLIDKKRPQEDQPAKALIAKRDFLIVQNEVRIEIKKGDELSQVPERFIENLKTENVI